MYKQTKQMSNQKIYALVDRSYEDLMEKAQDNLWKKHLIIHGDPNSGKSKLIRKLLKGKNYHNATLSGLKTFPKGFYKQHPKDRLDIDFLYFKDVGTKLSPEEFYGFTTAFPVQLKPHSACAFIAPRLVLEYCSELPIEKLNNQSLKRRFHIINTNTISYKEIIHFLIKWNNNEQLS